MKYMMVRWLHDFPSEPVVIYSEMDDARWEKRKIEVYRDGTVSFVGGNMFFGSSALSIEPLPPKEFIESDPQFEVFSIDAEEFENVWEKARAVLFKKN